NAKETTLAAQKQQAIRDAFKDWIWKDPDRRQALVRQYNEEMNSTRPREYDGGHITFGGMNPAITLREHQKNAIAHVLYGGNNIMQIWRDGEADKLTQLVFCDISTPQAAPSKKAAKQLDNP